LPAAITVPDVLDWRKVKSLTWRSAVRLALDNLGGTATLQQIYDELRDFVFTKKHKNSKAKIREILQTRKEFTKLERGVWKLVA